MHTVLFVSAKTSSPEKTRLRSPHANAKLHGIRRQQRRPDASFGDRDASDIISGQRMLVCAVMALRRLFTTLSSDRRWPRCRDYRMTWPAVNALERWGVVAHVMTGTLQGPTRTSAQLSWNCPARGITWRWRTGSMPATVDVIGGSASLWIRSCCVNSGKECVPGRARCQHPRWHGPLRCTGTGRLRSSLPIYSRRCGRCQSLNFDGTDTGRASTVVEDGKPLNFPRLLSGARADRCYTPSS